MCRASFLLKYYRANLQAGLLFVQIRSSLAGRGREPHVRRRGPQHLLLLSGKGSRRTSAAIRRPSKRLGGLGVAPGRWRGGDSVPSGSHCSGLAATADGWLRTEVQNGRQRVGRVGSFPRYVGVGGIVRVRPPATERKRTGPSRTGEDVPLLFRAYSCLFLYLVTEASQAGLSSP